MTERLKDVASRQKSSRWRIPKPLAVYEAYAPDGASIILRRHGNPEGPRLVLSHANGLSADSYYPFWSLLCDRFDLVLYDFRNHGWNPVGDLRKHNIPTFVRDNASVVRAIDRHFCDKPKIGVFHSMSAVSARRTKPKDRRSGVFVNRRLIGRRSPRALCSLQFDPSSLAVDSCGRSASSIRVSLALARRGYRDQDLAVVPLYGTLRSYDAFSRDASL